MMCSFVAILDFYTHKRQTSLKNNKKRRLGTISCILFCVLIWWRRGKSKRTRVRRLISQYFTRKIGNFARFSLIFYHFPDCPFRLIFVPTSAIFGLQTYFERGKCEVLFAVIYQLRHVVPLLNDRCQYRFVSTEQAL